MNFLANERKIGLIVNPIAGMGGRVGLKGTDGEDILERAIELGSEPISQARTKQFLKPLLSVKNAITILTYPGKMGEDVTKEMGFFPTVIGKITDEKTTARDTKNAAKLMKEMGVNLIVFVGGDGTARDVFDSVDQEVPVIGVPSGVKIYSSCFAIKPQAAARISMKFLWEELPLRQAEILDIDEKSYREENKLNIRFYGYLIAPFEPSLLQESKLASPFTVDEHENQLAIARHVMQNMNDETFYLLGPGTTVMAISEVLDLEKTLLGVDILKNKKIIALDVNENQIIDFLEGQKAKIIVSPIGRQGMIFGRGNQQISPKIIRIIGKENIIVISTRYKSGTIKSLKVDTQDPTLDEELKGFMRVIVDFNEIRMMKIE
ncbi:MAG: ATP-NAD kinase [Candidatus Lokiarchaeota archaeon]|nr:ATP-NAD kinase [Candidatus Lokiarchaeota archaeon]